jgi:hypothetical protein
MLIGQFPDVKDVVAVRDSFGLAVTVMAVMLALMVLGLVVIVRWLKPHLEELIRSHLLTMETFRKNDDTRSETMEAITSLQKQITQKIEEIPEVIEKQTVMLTRRLDTLSSELLTANQAAGRRDDKRDVQDGKRDVQDGKRDEREARRTKLDH